MTLQYEMDRYLDDHKDKWKAEGIEEGIEKAKISFVNSMFAKGISVEDIADIAHTTVDNVEEILSVRE